MIIIHTQNWSEFKTIAIQTKGLDVQYSEHSDRYNLYASEAQFVWQLSILKDSGPEVTDFETNYKSAGNAILRERVKLHDKDGNGIGSVSDRLKVDALVNVTSAGNTSSNIFKQKEFSIGTKAETDIADTSYTVPSGKSFALTSFNASYDSQATIYIRLKKQTGGTGPFVTICRITLEVGGQGAGTVPLDFAHPVIVGSAGDVFKLMAEATLIKGSLWAGFSGIEY